MTATLDGEPSSFIHCPKCFCTCSHKQPLTSTRSGRNGQTPSKVCGGTTLNLKKRAPSYR